MQRKAGRINKVSMISSNVGNIIIITSLMTFTNDLHSTSTTAASDTLTVKVRLLVLPEAAFFFGPLRTSGTIKRVQEAGVTRIGFHCEVSGLGLFSSQVDQVAEVSLLAVEQQPPRDPGGVPVTTVILINMILYPPRVLSLF